MNTTAPEKRKVGEIRPSQLLYNYGVGSVVELPNLSVMVMGLDDWPIEGRFKGGTGKPGLLHVKCAVADGRSLFLSSANLTEQAFSINMELGTLITGGTTPAQVKAHFGKMIESGTLVKV